MVMMGGIANGCADNSLSVLLFEYAVVDREPSQESKQQDKQHRATAEALSSFGANLSGAIALAFANLSYAGHLTTWLLHDFADGRGRELAEKALDSISNVNDFNPRERTVTLQRAVQALRLNFKDANWAVIASIVTALVLLAREVGLRSGDARRQSEETTVQPDSPAQEPLVPSPGS